MRAPGRAARGSWPAAAVREACAALEIAPGDARVLRLGHCAVVALPAAGPVGRVEERLALYASRVTARGDYVSLLSTACDEARVALTRLRSALGIGLVHGDPLNVVLTARGPLLLDFDLAGVGPAEWDLVSV